MHTLALSLMRMPVETTVIRVDGAEDTGFQPPFSGGIQQILHRQTAHVIQQPTVASEHRPQRVRQGEDQVYPVAIWLEEASTNAYSVGAYITGRISGQCDRKNRYLSIDVLQVKKNNKK